ncbi:MAG TPA: type IV toxin-antitoxin system AbiEi family antitoxin [Cytophagaceae bacterium]|jgi:hypothetical protein|nr:type IV toxin-antitoxin system AbiEi family antitoxin [Cytophagaceae bacterium]
MNKDIVDIALENLHRMTEIQGTWNASEVKEMDGVLNLFYDNQHIQFNIEVKRELRNYHLDQLLEMKKKFAPLMVIAEKIFPKIKEEFRHHHIAYLETNGNIYFKERDRLVWIDANKPLPKEKEKGNLAFNKTGLKVVFLFLINEEYLNMPYRKIAKLTETALGNIKNVITGLKEQKYIIKLNEDQNKLTNKEALLDKWVNAYEERLKPVLEIGTFRFLKEEDFYQWKKIPLNPTKTCWGGEPAGDLLTDYLNPEILTLYTTETRNELMKNYRLIPDEKGNVKVNEKFWQYDEENANHVAPPLLVYADLINTRNERCIETAKKIFNEKLKDRLK